MQLVHAAYVHKFVFGDADAVQQRALDHGCVVEWFVGWACVDRERAATRLSIWRQILETVGVVVKGSRLFNRGDSEFSVFRRITRVVPDAVELNALLSQEKANSPFSQKVRFLDFAVLKYAKEQGCVRAVTGWETCEMMFRKPREYENQAVLAYAMLEKIDELLPRTRLPTNFVERGLEYTRLDLLMVGTVGEERTRLQEQGACAVDHVPLRDSLWIVPDRWRCAE
jgi:hypothetical protein